MPPNITSSETEARQELQQIISFMSNTESCSSFFQTGRIEVPILAPSPSTEDSREDLQDDIPRAVNPIVLNTPFVQESSSLCGAELGLLSPSPPPNTSQNWEPNVNIQRCRDLERKKKRLRSTSCPEAKRLLA